MHIVGERDPVSLGKRKVGSVKMGDTDLEQEQGQDIDLDLDWSPEIGPAGVDAKNETEGADP